MTLRLASLTALFAASCAAPSPTVESRLPSESETAVAPLLHILREGDIVSREQAMGKLVELGPDALPVLRLVQASESDGEVLGRLKRVIEKLGEQERLVNFVGRPKLIELSARRIRVTDALNELARLSGVPVEWNEIPGDLVDVDVRGVPIWTAVDAVCRTHGGLQPEWSEDRVIIRRGPFKEPPGVDWKIGPITMGRFWLEFESVALEWRKERVLETRARLLLSPGKRLYGAVIFLDAAQNTEGQSLCAKPEGTVCLQEGNHVSADRAVALEVRSPLYDVRIPSEKEILNSRGTVYFSVAQETKRLALFADLTPKVHKHTDSECSVSTYVHDVHRSRRGARIKYEVTFPMMTDGFKRIIGPFGARLLTAGGEAIHPAEFHEQDCGGSMGATDWFYEARFNIPSDVPIAGLEVLQPAETMSIRIEYDFPRLPVVTR